MTSRARENVSKPEVCTGIPGLFTINWPGAGPELSLIDMIVPRELLFYVLHPRLFVLADGQSVRALAGVRNPADELA